MFERPAIFSNFPGNLKCAFICFGTRIREEDLKSTRRISRLVTRCKTQATFTLGSCYKKRCESRRPFVVIYIARVDDLRGLFIDNLQAFRHQPAPLDKIHTFKTPSSACPNELTAMPALKSKYFLPSVSQTYDPFPCEMTNSGRA